MTTEEMITYDQIVEMGIATSEEINLAFNVANTGWTEVLNKIISVRTGYHSIQQMIEAEDEEEMQKKNKYKSSETRVAQGFAGFKMQKNFWRRANAPRAPNFPV